MNSTLFSCEGKVALVTGGTRGLGLGIVEALSEAGADIVCVGRNDSKEARDVVTGNSRRYHFISTDLAALTAEKAQNLVGSAVAVMGRIDILFNNAGGNKREKAIDYKEEDWDYILSLNLKSVFLLSQSVAKQFLKQGGGGKIINTASLLSYFGGVFVPAYTSSKSAVMGLTKALSNEWSEYGINVNGIAPGYMATDLTKAIQDDDKRNQEILSRIPAQRWGKPEDLKGIAVFLASAASDYVCGATINVDGGWLGR